MRKFIIPSLMAVALTGVSTIAMAQTTTQTEAPATKMDGAAKSEGMKKSTESAASGTVGVLVIKVADAESWVGKRVYSSTGSDIGEISAYHAGSDGVVEYFHTDIGGFLGLGETSVQVKPSQFDMRDEKLYLNMTKDEALKLPRITE